MAGTGNGKAREQGLFVSLFAFSTWPSISLLPYTVGRTCLDYPLGRSLLSAKWCHVSWRRYCRAGTVTCGTAINSGVAALLTAPISWDGELYAKVIEQVGVVVRRGSFL